MGERLTCTDKTAEDAGKLRVSLVQVWTRLHLHAPGCGIVSLCGNGLGVHLRLLGRLQLCWRLYSCGCGDCGWGLECLWQCGADAGCQLRDIMPQGQPAAQQQQLGNRLKIW